MRRLVTLAVSLLAAAVLASSAEARTGTVFIHGAGSNFLNDAAGARAYWTEDMLRTATRNGTVPSLVVHYDGTQLMWIGGDQAAAQIYDWMMANGIDDIVVNTHSFGGTIIRWIMSNPSWNTRYPAITARIRWVNTLAAPHKGSEAANLAGTLGGSWLTGWLVNLVGSNTDAHKNCRTDWMAYYNQYYLYGTSGRPALPRGLYTVAGTGLWNDLAHSEDYGLATLSGVAGMPGEDDGMVSQYSAQGVGTVWFTTDANHHHNRRNDYRRLGDNLASDFAFALGAGSGKSAAAAAAGPDTYAAPSSAAPAQVSRTFVRTVALREGRATLDLPLGEGSALVWTIAAGADEDAAAVQGTLLAPSGEPVALGLAGGALAADVPELGVRGTQQTLRLAGGAAGTYRLDLGGGGTRGVVTVVAAQPDSALTLTTWSGPLSRQPGQPVMVYASLSDSGAALAGATVSARLAPPQGLAGAALRLFDDGRHGDGAAGDGLYAARVDALAADAGLWTVRVEASGADVRGLPFARTGGSGFVTEAGGARLRSGSVRARVATDASGRVLHVEATADVTRPGRYRLDAVVAGRADGEGAHAAVGNAESTRALPAGRVRLRVDVPLRDGAEAGLVDVRLLGMDVPTLAGRTTLELK